MMRWVLSFVSFLFWAGAFADPAVPAQGLAARYQVSDLEVQEGGEVTRWAPADGSNPVPMVLLEDLGKEKAVAPTLHKVKINGFQHRALRFQAGAPGDRELLRAEKLLPDNTKGGTVLVAYRNLEASTSSAARLGGFGSSVVDPGDERKVWNFGADADADRAYGSFRFNGAFLGPHRGAAPAVGKVILRAMVRHADETYSDFISPAHDFIQIRKVLDREKPPKPVGPFPRDFYVGDVHTVGKGGGEGAFSWELFEVLVYDRALTEGELEQALKALNWRYTNPAEE